MRTRLVLAVATAAALALTVLPASADPMPVLDPDVVPAGVQDALGCDPLDPALCLLPFPNDRFTVADKSKETGRRIAFSPTRRPALAQGARGARWPRRCQRAARRYGRRGRRGWRCSGTG